MIIYTQATVWLANEPEQHLFHAARTRVNQMHLGIMSFAQGSTACMVPLISQCPTAHCLSFHGKALGPSRLAWMHLILWPFTISSSFSPILNTLEVPKTGNSLHDPNLGQPGFFWHKEINGLGPKMAQTKFERKNKCALFRLVIAFKTPLH